MSTREQDVLRRAGEASVLVLVSLAGRAEARLRADPGRQAVRGRRARAGHALRRAGPAREARAHRVAARRRAAASLPHHRAGRGGTAGAPRFAGARQRGRTAAPAAGRRLMSAPGAREGRLVGAALRCYPARWRRRHADEAAELAALLIGDGTPAASIAWSYLVGAAREWLTPRPGRSAEHGGGGAAGRGMPARLLGGAGRRDRAGQGGGHDPVAVRPGPPDDHARAPGNGSLPEVTP